ncbi:hypothetical protein MA20_30935 [Bradyrhizobium japonicum]|uniref:Uncharacterized protein n=2 Tax=Bradyrhizobium japonicum TaxID=375 RepID=A0A0A3XR75_BRAJP|nr:hypothetical protein MA20_30935 [Bradyrhizobium japonicum]
MPRGIRLQTSHTGFHRGIFYCVKRDENSDRWQYSFSVSEQDWGGIINARLELLAARRVRTLIDKALNPGGEAASGPEWPRPDLKRK